MPDHLDKESRSWDMIRIRGKDTKPEIAVRENVRKSSLTPSLAHRWPHRWPGVRHPEAPARILLQVIDREPEAVMRALHG